MKPLPAILERLQGVRQSGDGWTAICPAHEDRRPSLSINVRQGNILLHCHAGCAAEAICAAAGIEMRDLFIETKPQATKARIIAEYGYIDESSKLLFQVVRLDPKGFRQRRPDGNASWTWNLKRVRGVYFIACQNCSLHSLCSL